MSEATRQEASPGSSSLPHHERIADAALRLAVRLLDAGDAGGLRVHLQSHPNLTRLHDVFEGGNYFQAPTLLEFIAENPVRHGSLPGNIVQVAEVILNAGVEPSTINEALGLVSTGRVARECAVQIPLIELLCDHGADPDTALHGAALQGEHDAARALIRRGARMDLPVAAALELLDDFRRLLPAAAPQERHMALAAASRFGHLEMVRLLLDAGEDPDRYNPPGSHAHSTPLHQAALAGHESIVWLLVERGVRLDIQDLLWGGTPADWARHEGRHELEAYLRAQEALRKKQD
jgi:hypothetical protein